MKIIPIVIGSFGAALRFGKILNQVGIIAGTKQVQKTVLIGMTGVLRKVLEM